VDNILLQISFFDRVLYPLYSSYHAQTYYGLALYLLLAASLCGLLAALAYLFSLSSVQDSEKRSEYECGFEPFDSATRLPFDVHFYLVGILFLIFDVEIALLFPWVLGLRISGWFGFYLMLGFILLLAIGFLYEWKRGALIWPSRQQELPYVTGIEKNSKELFSLVLLAITAAETFSNLARATYILAILFVHFAPGPILYLGALFRSSSSKQLSLLNRRKVPGSPSNLTHDIEKLKLCTPKKTDAKVVINRMNWTKLKLNAWSYKTAMDYVNAAKFVETELTRYKKAINTVINQTVRLAAVCRNKYFRNEKLIEQAEQTVFKNLVDTKIIHTYQDIVKIYKGLYHKIRNNKINRKGSNSQSNLKLAKMITQYLQLKHLHFPHKKTNILAKERALQTGIIRLTQRQKPPVLRLKKVVRNPKAAVSTFKKQVKQASVRSLFFYPIVHVTSAESYPFQFLGTFLPELTLTAMLAIVLTLLAVELGQGRSKKDLALESLVSLRQGLTFIAALYFLQLCYGIATPLFNGYVLTSPYTLVLKMLTVLSGRFILSSSEGYLHHHPRHLLEYPVVMTLAVLFMLLLVGAGHLISAFLALVGFSLNLYVLILFDATSAVAREAGIKYFYLSTISSGLMLYGTFLLFLVLGSGHFFEIGQILATETELIAAASNLLQLGLTFLLIGLFFKLSAFPGHLWAAEVYEGSPDPITAFFMLPVKVAVLAFLLQLLTTAFEPATTMWQPLIMTSSAFSLMWGCLAALAEKKVKRFLAYASINQIGFLLLGIASGSFEGHRATLLYLLLYAIMNVGFLVVFLHARRPDGTSLLYITDFRGFGQQYKQYSWSIAMILLSMAGIPPLAGFFGKYYLLLHAQEQELYGLVIVGLATSLVSTYYYLRIIKVLWFEGAIGMTPVSCELTWQNRLTLQLSEWSLWLFIIYSAPVIYGLDNLISSLIVFNDFSGAYFNLMPNTARAQ
jgi:NADH-quinone oxidoreductase subunit N